MYEKQIFFRYPEFRCKALTFSYDDGVHQDRRLIEIMQKNGLKGTFHLNSGLMGTRPDWLMSREECAALYPAAGMEVALHGYTHTWLEQQPSNMVVFEVMEDRRSLEELFGHPVTGMSYPFGTYNETVLEVLRLSGVAYSRTVESTHRFDLPADWLRLHPTCHHKDKQIGELADRFLAIKENPDRRGRSPMSMFYIWGHSYEFDTDNNWEHMEALCEKLGGHEDIWYATNGEIYRYVQATKRLEVAADGSSCYNPTAFTLYFYQGNKPYVVKPGETIKIG